jgi:hypothetical protein
MCLFSFSPLLLSSSSAVAQDTKKEETKQETPAADPNRLFLLKGNWQKGQSLRFHTQQSLMLKIPGSKDDVARGVNSGVNVTMRYLVRDAKPEGEAQVAYLYEEGRMQVDNAIKILPKDPDDMPRVAMLNALGRILSIKDESKLKDKSAAMETLDGTDASLFLQLHLIPLPDRAVKIGESWTVRYPRVNAKPDEDKTAKDSKSEKKPDNAKPDDKDDKEPKGEVTLIGVEKFDGQELLKVRHVLSLPFEAYTDAQGRMVPDKKRSAGRLVSRMICTQLAYLLPVNGILIRSEGKIEGEIKVEGALAKQLGSDTMVFGGEFVTGRLADKP